MSKTVMVLRIPEPKVRKALAKASQPHRDKTKYTRKEKHKAPAWGPLSCLNIIECQAIRKTYGFFACEFAASDAQ